MTGTCVLTGFEYRGEMIHVPAIGPVVVFPSWLGGKVRAEFVRKSEALNFVDARRAIEKLQFAEQAFGGSFEKVSGEVCDGLR